PAEDERLANFVVNSHGRAHPVHSSALGAQTQSTAAANEQHMDVDVEDESQAAAAAAAQRPTSPIAQELLRKYILYAREHCRPKLYQIDQDKIARLFADMRRESLATGAYPITVRHLESILRIAESFAKMRLAEYCTSGDIDRAIAVAVDSFVGSQKMSCKKALARAFAKYTLARPGAVKQRAVAGRRASGREVGVGA
ncbi:MCM DNA helicase complex subunit, partial [Friedmanniomyces endolithicus]